jgi:hypothetical protein
MGLGRDTLVCFSRAPLLRQLAADSGEEGDAGQLVANDAFVAGSAVYSVSYEMGEEGHKDERIMTLS